MRFYAVALAVVALDQISKLWIQATIPLGHSIPLIPDFFAIVHVLNPGAAFGLLAAQAAGVRNPFFIGISLLAIGFILYYRHRRLDDHPLASLGLSLILGGAVGNLTDRLRIGMVVDFIDVHYYQYHWPAFNVADSGITIGVSLMMLTLILDERRGRHRGPAS
ncbi:MAG: signal peptidase II [Candidatus Methylomirabilota bacterium]|nr:signal peptidase II [Candidatus Methylomirabilis sp.]NJD67670.1 signal peptidase II [candidate division NC10 bacterium]PWB47287.1 MAG: signal peptidase II [candidate division NC10 bacterium]